MRNQAKISEVVEGIRQKFRKICQAIKSLFSEVAKFFKVAYSEVKKAEKKRTELKKKEKISSRSNWRINWDMRQRSQVHCKRPAFAVRKTI